MGYRQIFGFGITCLFLSVTPVLSADSPTKRALLIGVDDYRADHVSDLHGCVNDVQLMRNVLVGKFEVPPDNIRLLTNAAATHAGIVDAIRTHLIDPARAGDVVILHYSGHGSQMRDVSGDEIDDLDETIVPHDSRTEGIFDISDDQINGLLKQLTAKTGNVTFILDSCHSGAISRAGGNTVRKIDPDDRPPPPPPEYALSGTRGADEGIAGVQLEGSDYVLISGCRANELSNETRFNGQRHGALSWFLTAALQAAGEDVTYQDVMHEVEAEVSSRFPSQHPQLEGQGTDLRVFGTDRINTQPYVLVEPLGGDSVKIEAGEVYGIRKAATLRVYPPQTKDFRSGEEIATVAVTTTEAFTSTAKIIAGGSIQAHSRGVLEAVSYGEAGIPVYVAVGEGEQLARIADELAATTTLELVDSEADARIIVDRLGNRITVTSGDLESLAAPVAEFDDAAVERVVNQVTDLTHWLTVFDLKNPMSDLQIEFDLRREGDAEGVPAPREVTGGSRISYLVTNQHSQPLYLTVLDVSSDGSVALLYPPVAGEQQALPPGEKFSRTIEMFVPEGRDSVRDVLKVIATNEPINPAVFPQGGIRGAPPAQTDALQDPLNRFLAEVFHGVRAAKPVSTGAWTTRQQLLRVSR